MSKTTTILSCVLAGAAVAGMTTQAQILNKRGGSGTHRTHATAKAAKAPVQGAKPGVQVLGMKPSFPRGLKLQTSPSKPSNAAKGVGRAVAKIPEMHGNVLCTDIWDDTALPAGMYKIGETPTLIYQGPNFNAGAVVKGDYLFGCRTDRFGDDLNISLGVYEMATGENLLSTGGVNSNIAPGGMAYDPVSGDVYGLGLNMAMDSFELSRMTCSIYGGITPLGIAEIPGNWVACAFDSNGQMYGISYEKEAVGAGLVTTKSTLCKIDKATGDITEIGVTGALPEYTSSATIDTKTNRMFWNVVGADMRSWMYEVSLETGEATPLYEISTGSQIVGLYVPKPLYDDGVPDEVTGLQITFPEGGLNGKAVMKAPEILFDGSDGSGEMTIHLTVNNFELASTRAAYGADVELDFSVSQPGLYDFTVYASNDTGNGPAVEMPSVFAGKDAPESPTVSLQYVNGNMELSWTPVVTGVNGGYIDVDNITYTVTRYPGAVTVADGINVTTFTEAIPDPEEMTPFYYTVTAEYDGIKSEPGTSNQLILGSIIPPFISDFTTKGLTGWTIIDGNIDGRTWEIDEEGGVSCKFNTELSMDDWLITPPVMMQKGESYEVAFLARCRSEFYPERLEVKYGRSTNPNDLTEVLFDPTEIGSPEFKQYSAVIIPDETGDIYIGFHGISPADTYYLFLDDIQISGAASVQTPGMATDLTVKGDDTGALKAMVSFHAPKRNLDDSADLTSLTKIDVYRGSELVKTFDSPTPGEFLSYEETLPAEGAYTYTVIGSNEYGEGLKATATGYVGINLPGAPAEVSIIRTDNDGEVTATWAPVETDKDGLRLNGPVSYTIYNTDNPEKPVLLAENLSALSYTFQACEPGTQKTVRVSVSAVNAAGKGAETNSLMIFAGTPAKGLHETGDLQHGWIINPIEGGVWGLASEAQLGIPAQTGTYYFVCQGQYDGSGAELISEMVSLDQTVNPALTFYVYNIVSGDGTIDSNDVKVYVKNIHDSEYTECLDKTVAELCGPENDGWHKVTVPLSAFNNQDIEFKITCISHEYTYSLVDNIFVGTILGNDLAATGITAPAKTGTGQRFNVSVKVSNYGINAADDYTVQLYADDELASTLQGTPLASGESTDMTFECVMPAIAEAPVDYFAVIVYEGDENLSNNETSAISVSPVVSKLPVPENLTAQTGDACINLAWEEPVIEDVEETPVTEDFEDAVSFSDSYGDWVFIDGDKSAIGGFDGITVPGITAGQSKGSFWIWDSTQLGTGNATFDAHSGSKYLFAFYRADDGTTDDWAISPELFGGAQTVSFFAKSYSSSYLEKIEVYYSTGSLDTDEFVRLDGVGGDVPNAWTEYKAELPAGAKRFAIRSCATGSLMLMVDDVTFTPANILANLSLTGYNVYRNGKKINDTLLEEPAFTDSRIETDVEYTYVVTASYAGKGESAGSNSVTIEYSGIDKPVSPDVQIAVSGNMIVIRNAEGLDISVARTDGSLLYTGIGHSVTEIKAEPGIYIIKAGTRIAKLNVR